MSAETALQRLKDGNGRFVNNQTTQLASQYTNARQELVGGQAPFAIILGCADSRVPPELIFDQGLGDLFVIRVAGNVADTAVTGSIEFGAAHLGASLLVVLGHSSCGAVGATIAEEVQSSGGLSPDLAAIVAKIGEGIRPLLQNPPTTDANALENLAIQQNTNYTISQLQAQSDVLRERVENGQLIMVSAQYMLESGKVLFLE